MANEPWIPEPLDAAVTAFAGIGLLALLLAVAVWYDVRSRRIPNALVLSGAVLALAMHTVLPAGFGFASSPMGGVGFLKSLAGLAVGLASLLPLYALRAMGAGDVKLMAMVGTFLGPIDTLGAVIAALIAGAALAVAVGLMTGVLSRAARNVRLIVYSIYARLSAAGGPVFDPSTDTAAKVPYAIAIAVGTGSFLALKWLVIRS
jgi:prepilin peptidase CpaA